MNEFLDPENRVEAMIVCAGVALHALASNPSYQGVDGPMMVATAFSLAHEFLKQAEALKP